MSIDAKRAVAMYVTERKPDGSQYSLQEIADELDCTAPAIRYVLLKHRVELRPRGGARKTTPLDDERLRELWTKGMGINLIGKELGVGWKRVTIALRRLGLSRLPGAERTLDDAKIARAYALRAQKCSWAQVAWKIGVPATTIRKALTNQRRLTAALEAVEAGNAA